MRALQVTAPGEAVVVEVLPPQPKPGEVVLRVRMVGMCGSDLNTFRGKNPMVSYPRVLGHEIRLLSKAPALRTYPLEPTLRFRRTPIAVRAQPVWPAARTHVKIT